jgi:Ni/Co efflux regulator RcnB
MKRFLVPIVAATLGIAAVATYAEEVKLTDHDRVELRQRADGLRSENALGRTRDQGAEGRFERSGDVHPTKAKHAKKRHLRRAHARPST